MNASTGVKILLFILVSGTISLFTYFVSVFMFFILRDEFYIYFVIAVALGMLFFICNGFFRFLKGNSLKIAVISFIALLILSIAINEGINAYTRGIPTLNNSDVDLYEYRPFVEESKAVQLDEPASFKMQGELPIIDGATALYPIYAAFAQATYPDKEYDPYNSEVMSNRTPNAYESLINGEVDMIIALAPSKNQVNRAKNRGVELKLTPIGKEAFVFFANSKNQVAELSVDEIKGIYSGEITNWNDIGGANDSIRAFQRPADSGSQTTLERLMGDTPIMDPPQDDIVSLMGGIIEQTADYKNYKNAIGYSFRYFSKEMVENNSIRHLAIDGVYPTKETIRNGEYPFTSEFYVVTADGDNPNIEPFIEWILSEQGQTIIEETGYVPIAGMEKETNSTETMYSILDDKVYRVLLEETFELEPIEADTPILKRQYMVLDGIKGEAYPYTEVNLVINTITDIQTAREHLLTIDSQSLRLPPNTIVDRNVLEAWKNEGYEPIHEYWEESPEGLSMEDLE